MLSLRASRKHNVLKALHYLSHHSHERPDFESPQRNTDEIFVKEGTKEENRSAGKGFSVSLFDKRNVQMPVTMKINRVLY